MTEIYNKLKQPPKWALKPIAGGRLKGKTDINPQWRYEALDSIFGLCGDGWKYELIDFFTLPGADGEVAAFARINLYIKQNDVWLDPIPGFGGSMLVSKEKNGLVTSDEAYKMAITDALSVACKMIGVGADIYKGLWDGAKYQQTPQQPQPSSPAKEQSIDDKIKNFKEFIKSAKLEELNGEKYKTKFNYLCKAVGEVEAEELLNLHNDRIVELIGNA